MEIEQAIDIVSYKLALKDPSAAQADKVLNSEKVEQAIADKAAGTEEKVDLKLYMQATKMLKQHRMELNKTENLDFLEKLKSQAHIQQHSSGLLYTINRQGDGAPIQADDTITAHYTGTLIAGTIFDSTSERSQPSTFALRKVIQGWQQGLPLIQQGGSITLYIPQELGYADQGFGSKVPAFATLIFDIEVLKPS